MKGKILRWFGVCILSVIFLTSFSDATYLNPSKLDSAATLGLLGGNNSLAYRTHEIEKHFHNSEDWFGQHASPSGEVTIANDITTGPLSPFQIDAGTNTWGAWVQILGSGDTPPAARPTMVKFDLHKIGVVDSETNGIHCFIQIAYGASGAAALDAGAYTTISYTTVEAKATEAAVLFMMPRVTAGTKVWARIMALGAETMTLDFYFGLHGYVG